MSRAELLDVLPDRAATLREEEVIVRMRQSHLPSQCQCMEIGTEAALAERASVRPVSYMLHFRGPLGGVLQPKGVVLVR